MSAAEHVVPPEAQTQPILPIHSSRERCPMCGAALAPDQRYCVECGQRCGGPPAPFADALAQRAAQAPGASAPARRFHMSANSTMIAGVGTLLLAMGIGVLIGRSAPGSTVKSVAPAVQVVTVPGAGAAAGASAEPQTPTGAGSTKPGAAGAAAGAAGATAAAKSTSTAAKKTPAPSPKHTVTVGSAGKGPGYQHGHFTGNFFGE